MTNEASLVVQVELPINFTSSTAIEKGAILKFSDPMTAAKATGTRDIVAGIAAAEVTTNDVSVPVYRRGIFRVYASGSVTAGDRLSTFAGAGSGGNYVGSVNSNMVLSGSQIIGLALETANTGETFLMELNIQ